MTTRSDLSTRMKSYEGITHLVLPRRTYIVLRVDGRAFHTYLRKAQKPFDLKFMRDMDQVTELMCRQIAGVVFAYTQSDEISFLLQDFADHGTEPWFGGVVQKIASVSASMATVFLDRLRADIPGIPPTFDARVFPIGNAVEVANYFLERQQDARRNAISMIARTMFTDRELDGKNVKTRIEMIEAKQGPLEENYTDACLMGRVVIREADDETWGGYVYNACAAPEFSAQQGSFLARLIPPLPAFQEYQTLTLNGAHSGREDSTLL